MDLVAAAFDNPLSRAGPEAAKALLHPGDVEPVLDELVAQAGLYELRLDSPPEDVEDRLRRLVESLECADPLRKQTAIARTQSLLKEAGIRGAGRFVEVAFRSVQKSQRYRVDRPRQGAGDAPNIDQSNTQLSAINAGDKNLARVTAATWSSVKTENEPPFLFRYGDVPVDLVRDDQGRALLRPLTRDALRHHLARIAQWYRISNGEVTDALPPMHVVRDMLASPAIPLPLLRGLIQSPAFAPGGELHVEPGYHHVAGTYYAPQIDFRVPEVPQVPSGADIEKARELILDELLGDFPFVSNADRAHSCTLLIQPFVRSLISGPTPLHLIEKPTPGTGAGLLAEVLSLPFLAYPAATMTEGRSEDEWRKRLTAKLLESPAFILIDNVRNRLDSAALSAALTTTLWEDRILGLSKVARIPVRCTWIATANNPLLSSEISRRSIRIRLDAKVDRPWERSAFRHADLRGWALERRAELVWAALTFGQAWIAAGRPLGSVTLGSYDSWAHVMAGICNVVGIPGFLDNLQELYAEADVESAAWRSFVMLWFERYGDQPVGVSELWSIASPEAGDIELGLGSGNDRSQRSVFGRRLKQMRDRTFGTFRLCEAGARQGAQLWRLIQGHTP